MEVKSGYKQTEVGVIPEAWDVTTLLDLAERKKELFDDGDWIEAEYLTERGIRLIQTGNIGEGSFADKDSKKYISAESFKKLGCKDLQIGDLLICRLAEPAGRACILPDIGEDRLITAVDVTIFRPPPAVADRRYLVNVFTTPRWFQRVNERCGGSTRTRIARGELGKITIAVPPPPEQRAIAEALSDVDGLLGGLDRLIAKKRDLKQAAMQQLLTGQTRLPGFDGEWDKSKVGSVVREGRKTQRHAGTGEKSGLYRFFTNNTQDDEMFLNQFDFDGEAVIANTGGTAFFQYFRGRFAASMHCLILFSEINVKFLYFALKLRELRINESCFQGSGLKVLNKKALRDLVITLPRSIEEQSAIVDVLTCMDIELAALMARRDKTRDLKQGLMQELLTGRTRLVPVEVRHA